MAQDDPAIILTHQETCIIRGLTYASSSIASELEYLDALEQSPGHLAARADIAEALRLLSRARNVLLKIESPQGPAQ